MKGYKIFNNDWTCKGFQYEVGKEYEFKGKIVMCESGFHFCTKIEDCFKYYPSVQWNKIAEVEATGKTLTHKEDSKICTDKLKIIREVKWPEIDKIAGNYIRGGNDISGGNDIRGGNYIWGGNNIWGGSDIWGCLSCEGVSRVLFCYKLEGAKLQLFNKPITAKRFDDVKARLDSFNWYPTFNNLKSLYLKAGSIWEETPIPNAKEISKEEAWAEMPKEMLEYIKSLKEFDAKIFYKITGIKVGGGKK